MVSSSVCRVSLANCRHHGQKPLPRCGWSAFVPRGGCLPLSFMPSMINYGLTVSWTFQPFSSTVPGPVELCDSVSLLQVAESQPGRPPTFSPLLIILLRRQIYYNCTFPNVLGSLNLPWRPCWAAVPDWMNWTSLGALISLKRMYRWLSHMCQRPSPAESQRVPKESAEIRCLYLSWKMSQSYPPRLKW